MRWVIGAGLVVLLAAGCSSSAEQAPVQSGETKQPAESPTRADPDSGLVDEDAPTDPRCMPKDAANFQQTWKPPAARQHVCTEEQLQAILPCALGDGTQEQCARFISKPTPEDNACRRCIATGETAAAWGPTVWFYENGKAKAVKINRDGCIAVVDPSLADCARASNDASACVHEACFDDCLSNETISEKEKFACSNAASLGTCQVFVERDVRCSTTIRQGSSPAKKCLEDDDTKAFFYIAREFCGE